MSAFEKKFRKPVAKDNPHFDHQIRKWKNRREGWLESKKNTYEWTLALDAEDYDKFKKILKQEIAELESK